jgi:hypothetical protein
MLYRKAVGFKMGWVDVMGYIQRIEAERSLLQNKEVRHTEKENIYRPAHGPSHGRWLMCLHLSLIIGVQPLL